jgi:hypothetical protein
VKWEEIAKDGAAEPEHPAPSLKLAAAITPVAASTDAEDEGGSDTLARVLGGVGLLLGLAALGLALRPRKVKP